MDRTALQARQELNRIRSETDSHLEALEQEIQAVQASIKQSTDEEHPEEIDWDAFCVRLSELHQERNAVAENVKASLHRVLFVSSGSTIGVVYQNPAVADAGMFSHVSEAIGWLQQMIGMGTVTSKSVHIYFVPGNRSSHTPSTADIRLTKSAGTATVIHEMGHWLEDADPEILTKARRFYYARTAGEPLVRLVDCSAGNYDPSEKTRLDRWLHPYMGKDYYSPFSQRYATEILSMGLELLYTDPCRLSEGDPELFDFLYDLLRGR